MQVPISERIDPPVPPFVAPADRKGKGLQTFLPLLLLALGLGSVVEYLAPFQTGAVFGAIDLRYPSGVIALFSALALVVVAHEGGHLLAALLMNFQILGIALGPFRAMRSYGKWRVRFSAKSLFSGSVSAVPRNAHAWRKRMLVVVAGGPAATLISGAIAAAALLSHASAGWTTPFIGAFTQLSLIIFVLGLVPNSHDARVRNDARLLLVLSRHSPEASAILLYHLVTQLEVAGTRPQDYPERLIHELAVTHSQPDLMLFSAHTIFLWALDRGHLATADAWDQRCLELSEACQPRSRNLALANSACFDLLFRNKQLDARNKLADVDWQTLSPSWLTHRSRAAYYLALEKVPECLAEISRAQYAFPKHLPIYVFERRLLSRLHEKALSVKPMDLCTRAHQLVT